MENTECGKDALPVHTVQAGDANEGRFRHRIARVIPPAEIVADHPWNYVVIDRIPKLQVFSKQNSHEATGRRPRDVIIELSRRGVECLCLHVILGEVSAPTVIPD